MPTETKRASSRANGKKSRGPKTETGKNRSKMNALKHGLTGEFIVLPGESHSAFECLKQAYIDRLQPQDAAEYSIALRLAQWDWELQRACRDQHIATVMRMEEQRPAFDREFENPNPAVRITRARQTELKDGESVRILEHHIVRLDHRMSRGLRRLVYLRTHFPLPSDQPSTPPAAPPPPETLNSQNEPETHLTPAESMPAEPASVAPSVPAPSSSSAMRLKAIAAGQNFIYIPPPEPPGDDLLTPITSETPGGSPVWV